LTFGFAGSVYGLDFAVTRAKNAAMRQKS